jgi:hypothetical protein
MESQTSVDVFVPEVLKLLAECGDFAGLNVQCFPCSLGDKLLFKPLLKKQILVFLCLSLLSALCALFF